MIRVLDLFSGIGGFSLGLERAGMRTVAFCEIEEYPRKVLKKHWPDVPIFEDVRKLKGEQVGTIDLICGGYPCQPFSVAGERRGKEDDRHLWPEVLRLLRETKAPWFVGENVAGHISLGIDEVLSDLANESYAAQVFNIPACAVNAHHRRERIWIVANATGAQKRRMLHTNMERLGVNERRENTQSNRQPDTAQTGKCSSSKGCESRGINAAGIPPEPGMGRVAYGIPGRVDRIRALGNAVVPQIPEIIGRAIMAAEGF